MADNEKTYCPRCRTSTSSIGEDTCKLCFTEKALYKASFKKLCLEIRQLNNKLSKIEQGLPPFLDGTKLELRAANRKLDRVFQDLIPEFEEEDPSYDCRNQGKDPNRVDKSTPYPLLHHLLRV